LRKRENGLSKVERKAFVDANPLFKDWLRNKAPGTQRIYAFNAIKYFQWAQAKYGFESPEKMINDHVASQKSQSIQERKKHARWKAKSEFKFETYAKYEYKQFGVDDARRIIDAAPQREKVIFLMMLQGGLRIGDLLNHVNYRWNEIKPQLAANKDPIKLTMYGAKYWTYITTDAIHELRKYAIERGEPKEGEAIFVSRANKPVSPVYVADCLQRIGLKLGLISESELTKLTEGHRYPIKLHQFRKLFKSESSVAGRGFDSRYAEFFMGHAGGIAQIGGVYDKSPELHEEIFEAEYKKLTPYLNVFTGIQSLEARVKEIEKLKADMGPEMVERLQRAGVKFRKEVSKPETETDEACKDGEHCETFKQVSEAELLNYLQDGWRIIKELKSGEVIVSR
jgi:integrase